MDRSPLYRLAAATQRSLLEGPWPPVREQRGLVDTWATLYRWNQSGEGFQTLTANSRSPVLPADQPLATTPLPMEAMLYLLKPTPYPVGTGLGYWILLARHHAGTPIPVLAPDRTIGFPAPLLTYLTEVDGRLASGFVNLHDQPTPSALRMFPGLNLSEAGHVTPLTAPDIAPEMIRLARVLPFFFQRS